MSAAAVGIVSVVLVATVLDLWLVFTWTRARRDAAALLAEAKRECELTRRDLEVALARWQAANGIMPHGVPVLVPKVKP